MYDYMIVSVPLYIFSYSLTFHDLNYEMRCGEVIAT